MKKEICLFVSICITLPSIAQRMLSIDSCRALAIQNNKELRIAQQKIDVAAYTRKAAFTNFLPRVDVVGTYMRMEKEASVLSEEQKYRLSNLGTSFGEQMKPSLQQLGQLAASNPILGQLIQPLMGLTTNLGAGMNAMGQDLANMLRTDTRNIYAATATLMQPIFMGGKIFAYHRITKLSEQLAQLQYEKGTQDLIVSTDEAYWQIVSLESKRALAKNYLELVKRLDHDVEKMVKEGVATKADGLTVKVKVNEAEMALLRVEDGLTLSKMVLCQLCGLPLDTDVKLSETELVLSDTAITTADQVSLALENRRELKMLTLATDIYRQKVNVVRADMLPSVALTFNYAFTNPSMVNGFENKFRGMWTAGVVVKVPIFHWGEDLYKVKAAKAEATIAQYQLQNTREKIELQVTQDSYKVKEAEKRLEMSERNLEKADENLRFANLGFKEGVIPCSTVLEAQTAWMSAKTGVIDAQIDKRMSEVYLKKSLGLLK